MKKKKVSYFGQMKVGGYFKYYGRVYRKGPFNLAVQIIGKTYIDKYFWSNTKVIPVTVTIKVKEK